VKFAINGSVDMSMSTPLLHLKPAQTSRVTLRQWSFTSMHHHQPLVTLSYPANMIG